MASGEETRSVLLCTQKEKKLKNGNNSSEPRKGRTKVLWISQKSVDRNKKREIEGILTIQYNRIVLLKFEGRSYFDRMNPINGIIKS